MSFVERFIILCPYLGEFTIGGSTAANIVCSLLPSLPSPPPPPILDPGSLVGTAVPVDVNWWTEDAVIVAYSTGDVIVADLEE